MTQERLLFEGKTGPWEIVIGLEVHAQAISNAKLFSRAATSFAAEPNSKVAFLDAAMPGMLPVLNEFCVEQAVKTGLGLNARINLYSRFDRKNYFYADLPQGYQISQFYDPIVGAGYLDIDLENGSSRRIGIERLHLEQDAGKSTHDMDPHHTYIDLNRAGTALMEIVSKPDMQSSYEAMAYVKKMRQILRYLGTNDGNMEEGSLRADVNVSVNRPGAGLGTKVEIKNVNSIRFIGQAIEYEVQRQVETLESGGKLVQETRLFDAGKGETRSMRRKEFANDYRYFPDPDLLPVILTPEYVEEIRAKLPELPDARRQRFIDCYGLPLYDAWILVGDKETADFYEAGVKVLGIKAEHLTQGPKQLANWMMGDFFAALNRESKPLADSPVKPQHLAELVVLIVDGEISGRIAKDVFVDMWATGKKPSDIVKEKGLKQVSDTGAIEEAARKVLADHPTQMADYRAGKVQVFGFLVGQVMRAMKGQANPSVVNDVLRRCLEE